MSNNNDTPSRLYGKKDYVDHELDRLEKKKADDTKVESIKEIAIEAKKIAIKAKEESMKQHNLKESTEKLEEAFSSWKRIRALGLVGLVVAIVIAVGFVFNLNASVNDNTDAIAEIKTSVTGIQQEQIELREVIEENQKEDKRQDKENLKEIKKTITNAIYEMTNNK